MVLEEYSRGENDTVQPTEDDHVVKRGAMHVVDSYKERGGRSYRVLVARIESFEQLGGTGAGSIHAALLAEGLGGAVGIYFYRFARLPNPQAFTKIGEVSREDGVIVRKRRGWLSTRKYSDPYLKPASDGSNKRIYADALVVSAGNPLYFVFYEFDIENSFPKIDEIAAFSKHNRHFGRQTRNQERTNTFDCLGKNLVWHDSAFEEVLALELPSGLSYESAFALRGDHPYVARAN